MTPVREVGEDEAVNMALEGNEIILGGDPGAYAVYPLRRGSWDQAGFHAAVRDADVPDRMKDSDNRLACLCRQTVMDMNNHTGKRLLHPEGRDGGKDRMIYRLIVTSRILGDGSRVSRLKDYADPAFGKVDRGVAGRATDARLAVERSNVSRPQPGQLAHPFFIFRRWSSRTATPPVCARVYTDFLNDSGENVLSI